MKVIEQRLPQDFDKSFNVFRQKGQYCPGAWHYHPEFELMLVLKSTGKRMIGDHICYFEGDDLVLVGSGLSHVWINDDKADAIVIHFRDSFLGEKFLGIPEMKNFKDILQLSSRGIAYYGETRSKINNLMKQMISLSGLKRLSVLFEIFDTLATSSEYEVLVSPGYSQAALKPSDRFGKVVAYIMDNFNKAMTLAEIASIANMSVSTFCKFFKERFRLTFNSYLNNVRIGYACKLLADKEGYIVDIAYQSGFNNLANFNRQFKRHKYMTPTEYRDNLANPLSIN